MERLTLGSMFRDSAGYLDRYMLQVARLRELFDVQCVWAWGDCQDGTGQVLLRERQPQDVVMHISHGGMAYGSVDREDRWERIAYVLKQMLVRVPDTAPFVWVESDLIWDPSAIWSLVRTAERYPFNSVSPQVLIQGTQRWYDTWGFRREGKTFHPWPPYAPDFEASMITPRLMGIESCGSCFAVREDVLPLLKQWDAKWPLAMPNMWLDTAVSVFHPEPVA